MEDSVAGDRYDDNVDQDSTDEDLPIVVDRPDQSRYKAHFAGLGQRTAQKLDFRGLLSELRGLRRPKQPEQQEVVGAAPEPEGAKSEELAAPAPRRTCWADIESSDDEEPVEEQKPQEAPRRTCWADIESDDEEPVEEQKPQEAPRRTCWADIESDDEELLPASAAASSASDASPMPAHLEPTRAPTPPRVRPRLLSDESAGAKYRRRVVTWAQPLSGPAEPTPAAFAPGTPRVTETVSALADTMQAAQEDGWTTVQKKERRGPPPPQKQQQQQRALAAPPRAFPRAAPVEARRRAAATQTEKVLVNLEDGEFPVVRRLIGPGGAHLRRITESCSATVNVRGRGAGGAEPLHLLVSADPEKMPGALRQVKALVEDVRAQFKRSAQRASRGS